MINIRLITPHINERHHKLDELIDLADLPINFSVTNLANGPSSIESEFDEALAAPYVVGRAIEAEQEGIDAVIIDCMGDPGLDPAREAVSIPVLGPGETSLHIAAMLGHRFSFVTVLERIRPMIEKRARNYGVAEKMASVRAIDLSVLDIDENHEELVDRLTEASLKAITLDHADVIVLGCTGFLGVAEKLEQKLGEAGYPAPVVNPLKTTALTAFIMVRSGLKHSVLCYPGPYDKGIRGYELPRSGKFQAIK